MPWKTLKIVAAVLLVEIVLAAVIALAVVRGGAYDVAATTPHLALTREVLEATMDNSVRRRAADIEPGPAFADPDLDEGREHYRAMCVSCHGAPGEEPDEIGQGLNPPAPDLAESAADLSPQEIFWVLKHGVRMTGMPAFGPTHDDEKLWDITAFVTRLPGMTPAQYAAPADADAHEQGEHDAHHEHHEHEDG